MVQPKCSPKARLTRHRERSRCCNLTICSCKRSVRQCGPQGHTPAPVRLGSGDRVFVGFSTPGPRPDWCWCSILGSRGQGMSASRTYRGPGYTQDPDPAVPGTDFGSMLSESSLASHTITRGFKKTYGMALKLVYRAKNRCKSSWASAGAFPGPPGAGFGREAAQNRRCPVLPPPHTLKQKPKNHVDCVGVLYVTQ